MCRKHELDKWQTRANHLDHLALPLRVEVEIDLINEHHTGYLGEVDTAFCHLIQVIDQGNRINRYRSNWCILYG